MHLPLALACLLAVPAGAALSCIAISPAATDDWCNTNCNFVPKNCPETLCKCSAPGPAPAPVPPGPPTKGPQCAALPATVPLEQGATQRTLPESIKGGYAFISKYYQVQEKLVHNIADGNVNVLYHNFAQMQDACFPEFTCTFHGSGKFRIVTTMTPNDYGFKHPYYANVDIFLSDAVQASKTANKRVMHILSIGGWGWPHVGALCGADDKNGDFKPSADFIASAAQSYVDSFLALNAARTAQINDPEWFSGYDGIDWDLEAIDDNTQAAQMQITECELMLVHEVSWRLKAKGFVVTMTPPESYLDYASQSFDRRLDFSTPWTPNNAQVPARYDRESGTPMKGQSPNPLPAVKTIPALGAGTEEQKNFRYKGKNAYALLAACCPQCYDLIQPQPYEGWSRSGCKLQVDAGSWNSPTSVCMMEHGSTSSGEVKVYPMEKTTLSGITDVPTAGHYTVQLPDPSAQRDILVDTMTRYLNGWQIDFGKYAEDWDLPGREGTKATVKVQPSQLMLGYGNVPGWVNFLAYNQQPYSPRYQRQHQLIVENFGYKMPYFQPQYVKQALCQLGPKVRGWVAWNLGWDNDVASGPVQADPIEGLQETSFEVEIEKTACPPPRAAEVHV